MLASRNVSFRLLLAMTTNSCRCMSCREVRSGPASLVLFTLLPQEDAKASVKFIEYYLVVYETPRLVDDI